MTKLIMTGNHTLSLYLRTRYISDLSHQESWEKEEPFFDEE